MPKCLKCGSVNQADATFCSICGADMRGAPVPRPHEDPKTARLCPKCHAEMDWNTVFCGECGTRSTAPEVPPSMPPPGPRCPKCSAPMAAGSDFCGECGTRISAAPPPRLPVPPPPVKRMEPASPPSAPPPPPPSSTTPALRCRTCAAPLKPGVDFCDECGTPLRATAPAFVDRIPPAAAIAADALPTIEFHPPIPAPATPMPPPAAKKSSAGLIALVGILLAAIGAGGFFGYRTYTNRNAANQAAQAPPVDQTQAPAVAQPPAAAVPAPALPESAADQAVAQPAVAQPAAPQTAPTKAPPASQTAAKMPAPTNKPTPAGTRQNAKAPAKTAAGSPAATTASAAAPTLTPAAEPPPPASSPRPVAAPAYRGPASGLLLWSGQITKGENVVIDGGSPSAGQILSGALPPVPVSLTIEPKDITLAEAPSSANGWKRFSFQARKARKTVVTIHWTVQ